MKTLKLLIIFFSINLLILNVLNAQLLYIGDGIDFDVSQPIDRTYNYSTQETIYLQSELGTAKFINTIGYSKGSGTDLNPIHNVSIYMKHTSASSFVSGSYSLLDYTLVYQGNFPNNLASGWLDVNLTEPFYYNGINNLQILIIKGIQSSIGYFAAPAWEFSITLSDLQRSSSDDYSQPTYLWALPFRPDVRFGFSTGLPQPVLLLPADLATNLNIPIEVSWNAVPSATGYFLQVATNSNFDTIVNNSIEIGTSKLLNSLAPSTQYCWRVRAFNSTDTSNWSIVRSFTTSQGNLVQSIPLIAGWNFVSANVQPSNTAVSAIIAPVQSSFVQMKNSAGQIYMPPFFNALSNWNTSQAYQIFMSSGAVLPISGTSIVPESTPINITQAGWYWLPYYRTSNMSPALALASISGSFTQVKNISGQVYMPPFLNTLTNLVPNSGYMLYITQPVVLTYPANN